MPLTLANMRSLVKVDIGGRDDADAMLVVDHGINLGILLAAIIFKPVELRTIGNITYIANSEYYDFSNIKWLDLIRVRNTTDNNDLKFIPFELIESIISDNLDIIKYYSLFGTKLYIRKIPSVNIGIKLYYLLQPSLLTSPEEEIPFDGFDGFIRSVATTSTFAAFEETDSSNLWNTISSQLNAILSIGSDTKATFGMVKAYLDQMVSIAKGKGQ